MGLSYIHGRSIEKLLGVHVDNRRYGAVYAFLTRLGQHCVDHETDGRVNLAAIRTAAVAQWRTTRQHLALLVQWGALNPILPIPGEGAFAYRITGFFERNQSAIEKAEQDAIFRKAKGWRGTPAVHDALRIALLSQKEPSNISTTCETSVQAALAFTPDASASTMSLTEAAMALPVIEQATEPRLNVCVRTIPDLPEPKPLPSPPSQEEIDANEVELLGEPDTTEEERPLDPEIAAIIAGAMAKQKHQAESLRATSMDGAAPAETGLTQDKAPKAVPKTKPAPNPDAATLSQIKALVGEHEYVFPETAAPVNVLAINDLQAPYDLVRRGFSITVEAVKARRTKTPGPFLNGTIKKLQHGWRK